MSKLRNERYFASGVVGAVLALYAVSAFAYFSNNDSDRMAATNEPAEESLHAESKLDTHAHPASSQQLLEIMEKAQVHNTYSTLGSVNIAVPGAECKVTENNLDYSYNFRDVPDDCIETLEED